MSQRNLFQNDSDLWNAFQQGDIRAYKYIYQTHFDPLFAYGKRLCPDHDLVKDIVQDIFVDIWTSRSSLRDLHTIKFYLFKIMRNRLSKRQPLTTILSYEDLPDDQQLLTPSIESVITQYETSSDQASRLQKAIKELPSRQREAILLAFYHDFSNEEIAGIMGINNQSVINHLNRAFTALRDLLHRYPAITSFVSFFATLLHSKIGF